MNVCQTGARRVAGVSEDRRRRLHTSKRYAVFYYADMPMSYVYFFMNVGDSGLWNVFEY